MVRLVSEAFLRDLLQRDPPEATKALTSALGMFAQTKTGRVREQMAIYDLAIEQLAADRGEIEPCLLHPPATHNRP
jgi:hypothetical protein